MKKNYLYNLLQSLVNILFPIISFPYASHILGPVGIGKVQFAFSFAQYFALFATLGIPIYGVIEIAKVRGDAKKLSAVFSELTIIYFISSLIFSAIYFLIVLIFPYFSSDRNFYFSAALIILSGFSAIEWFYSGLEEFKGIAIRSILIKSIALFSLFLFVKDAGDYKNYLFIIIFSILGNNALSVIMIGSKVQYKFSNLELKRHLKPLFYIFGTTIAASIYTVLDTVLLGFLTNERSVGLYTAAVKLTKIALPLVTSIGVILIPGISKAMAEANMSEVQKLLDKSFHFIVFFSIPIVCGLIILAPEFIYIFSGPQFFPAILSMQVLAFLPLLIGMGYFLVFQILVPGGKSKAMFISVIGGTIICLTLNFLLVPKFHELGEALATVFAEFTVTALYFYYVKKYFSFKYDWSLLFKSILCSLLFIPVVSLIRPLDINMIVSLLLSVTICTIVYITAQWLVFRDHFIIETINSVSSKVPFLKL